MVIVQDVELVDRSVLKYYKPVAINNVRLEYAMIDPGSRVCLVNATTANQLRVSLISTKSKIFGVGALEFGSTPLGEFSATIEIDSVIVDDVPVLVLADHEMPTPIIIGRSWTEHQSVAYYKLRNNLVIVPASEFPFQHDPPEIKTTNAGEVQVHSEK